MKKRLDVLLVERGLAASREKAKAVIMSGDVFVKGQREDKAGASYPEDVAIEVRATALKYVSRGGYKLEKGIALWKPLLQNQICMDVGASTGGFTDCMLQNGAAKVYAVDVGTNQLAWKLRQDSRVVVMEKTNVRYITPEDIADPIDFFSVDVAFISLTKVLEPVKALLTENAYGICLVKPQFEAGREKVGKKGVVRDKAVHLEVLESIMRYVLRIGFKICGVSFSPIRGPEGNIEYLLYVQNVKGNDKEENEADMVSEEAQMEKQSNEQKGNNRFDGLYKELILNTVNEAHQKTEVKGIQ